MTMCISIAPSFIPRFDAEVSDGLARRRPSARTWRKLGLAFVVAAAAFWAVAPNAPKVATAASGEVFSAYSLTAPAGLATGTYAAH